jgi:putative holliday junction resolvase
MGYERFSLKKICASVGGETGGTLRALPFRKREPFMRRTYHNSDFPQQIIIWNSFTESPRVLRRGWSTWGAPHGSGRPMKRPVSLEELALALPPKARLLGVDLGAKTIGLAISDVERRIASPLRTLPRGAFARDAGALAAVFADFGIAGTVFGLPLDLDGRDTPRAQSMRAFAQKLSGHVDLPYVYWDERFSTAAVTRSLIENDVSRAKRARVIDQMAAAYILQGALDRLAGLAREKQGA